ncbi:hypothetical protein QTO34_009901 [Cnephaeus nilssonii]|uniref:Ig-like domain-containing protein n=1 Tax=Cnephaeus nilssonii TaxID=3371016 RepID=A0AA40HEI5_CNENI|nr:hypothetical protein QTO34_009901 [Eptesicus nilssonii]
MTSILSALLCLGTLPKPTIWAEPGPVIPYESPVTIWCQGTPKAQEYRLYANGNPWYLARQKSLEPGDRAKFLIRGNYAERYTCNYLSPTGWSGHSDPLQLVVTGVYSKPSLSALPSPVVTSGGNVTLQCGSWEGFDRFLLTKEGDHRLSWTLDSKRQPSGQSEALFPVGPVTPGHRWTFRCYGNFGKYPQEWSHPSDPLDLTVSGPSGGPSPPPTGPTSTAGDVRKPSIWADPGPIVTKGSPVTIWCQGSLQASAYLLYKERGSEPLEMRIPQNSSNKAGFLIEATTQSHAGLYQCAYHTTGGILSERSDPLLLVVTGVDGAPSLSAQPSPVVASGGNVSLSCSSRVTSGPFHLLKEESHNWDLQCPGMTVTMQCGSEIWLDTFHLHREGSLDPPQHLRLQDMSAPSQANFTLSPVSSGHRGTYRCYGSNSSSPYLLFSPVTPWSWWSKESSPGPILSVFSRLRALSL